MLTYSTAEPIYHFSTNPDVIMGLVEGGSAENVRSAFRWSFLHWGLSAWGCYALAGLALAFFSYNRGLPLTIRSGLAALFGRSLSGTSGHLVDIIAVVATILGVSVTIGFGVSQFAAGMFNITGAQWMINADGGSSNTGMLMSLIIVMGAATLSARSGVGKGIKWLSNINMGLSFFLLAFFLIFGSTMLALESLLVGTWDYITTLPQSVTTVWQNGWTVFYWAWWIAFAPFVGVFLARISRGRSIREYVLGAMIIPTMMCFVWFAFVGGSAIDLELSGVAEGAIMGSGLSSQLFSTINVMLNPTMAVVMSAIVVILLLTYLVTSADSAVLIINTINAAGDEAPHSNRHITIWGTALTLVIGVLLLAGGLSAIQTAMIVGALPFSVVLALMGLSLIKALVSEVRLQSQER